MKTEFAYRRGYAAVLAMLMLVLGTTMAACFYSMLESGRALARNHQGIQEATKAAESGENFLVLKILKVAPAAGLFGHDSAAWITPVEEGGTSRLMDCLQTELAPNLSQGTQLTYSTADSHIHIDIPAITLPDATTFTARISPTDISPYQHLKLSVTGYSVVNDSTHSKISRTIAFDLDSEPERVVSAMRFPIAARNGGMSGSSSIYGYDPATNTTDGEIRNVVGIGNDKSDPAQAIVLTQPGEPVPDFSGFVSMTFPQTDVSFLDTGHTSSLAKFSSKNPNSVITNTYIPAGTNPSFGSDVELRGIIYVEWPNNLSFSANTKINGVIVYQPATGSGKGNGSTITLDKNALVTNSRDQSIANLNSIAWLTDEQRKTLSSWAIIAPQTDLSLGNGNGNSKTFENSVHIQNVSGAGSGHTGASLIMNRCSLIAEDTVSLKGNRVFWISTPATSADNANYVVSQLYVMQATYREPS